MAASTTRPAQAKGAPVCVNLQTYPVKVEAGKVLIQIYGCGLQDPEALCDRGFGND